jgi:hypothetical protein
MNLPTLLAKVVITVVATTAVAHGENGNACTGLPSVVQPKGDLPDSVVERIRATARTMEMLSVPTGLDCAQLRIILSRLANGKVRGGKRLFGDQPPDVAAAQAELEQAQQRPELRASLDTLRGLVVDDQVRLLYEAALLQSKGLYGARDLRLQQFIAQITGD